MAAGIALATFEPMAPRVDAKTLYVDVVTRGELLRRVRGTGTLVPRDQRWIAAAAEGRVERVWSARALRSPQTPSWSNFRTRSCSSSLRRRASRAMPRAPKLASLHVQLESQVLDQRARIAEARAQYESARLQAEAEARLAGQHAVSP